MVFKFVNWLPILFKSKMYSNMSLGFSTLFFTVRNDSLSNGNRSGHGVRGNLILNPDSTLVENIVEN